MGSFLVKLIFNILLAGIPALVSKWLSKKNQQPASGDAVAAKVAAEQATIQRKINEIHAKPMPVSDAVSRLRKRAKPKR